MSAWRIIFRSVVVAALVFAAGIWGVPHLQRRLPLPLAIPQREQPTSEEDFFAAPNDESSTGHSTNADRVDEFVPRSSTQLKGIDLKGKLHRLGESDSCRALVLVFLGTECPIANEVIPRLNELAEECQTHAVEFFGIVTSSTLSHRTVLEHTTAYGIQFPVLFDFTGDLRERLQATHSPHAFVLTPQGRVLYRGPIDDQFVSVGGRRRQQPSQHWLRDAMHAARQATPEANADLKCEVREPIGCLLEPFEDLQPTFVREIAPIVYRDCATCHRTGAVGPFALTSYEAVKRHAAQIRVMVDQREMPPWRPMNDRSATHLRNELSLSAREVELVRRWVELGAPLGPVEHAWLPECWSNLDAPTAATAMTMEWSLGEPDLVLQVPDVFKIPSDGPDIYQYFVIPSGLIDDRLISAIDYRSDNPRVVHHASFRFDDAGQARRLDDATSEIGYRQFGGWGFETGGTLGGWAFGALPQRFPKGLGRRMPARSDLVVQTHYHPTGKPEREQATIGLYFADTKSHQRIGELIIADQRLHIPPQEQRFVHRVTYELPTSVTAYSIVPHAHLLGRQLSATARLQNGRRLSLIRIDDWRFNWQGEYFFKQPIHLPAQTRIEFEVLFDNSETNPSNPNPIPKWIHWGEASTQEMAVCFLNVSAKDAPQLDKLLAHNRDWLNQQR